MKKSPTVKVKVTPLKEDEDKKAAKTAKAEKTAAKTEQVEKKAAVKIAKAEKAVKEAAPKAAGKAEKAAPKAEKAAEKSAPKASEKPAEKSAPKKAVKAAPKAEKAEKAAPKATEKPAPKAEKQEQKGYSGKWVISPMNGGYTFELRASNGEKMLSGGHYTTLAGAKGGIETYKNNIKKGNFRIVQTKMGDYIFQLLNASGKLLAVLRRRKEFFPRMLDKGEKG